MYQLGYQKAFADLGLEKQAFVGAVARGIGRGIRGLGSQVGLTGAKNWKLNIPKGKILPRGVDVKGTTYGLKGKTGTHAYDPQKKYTGWWGRQSLGRKLGYGALAGAGAATYGAGKALEGVRQLNNAPGRLRRRGSYQIAMR